MYLWKVDSLVEDFKSGNVPQKEEFKYMLFFSILMALASDPSLYIGATYNYYDTLTSALVFSISTFGIYYCYKINANGDDKDFIVRAFCIGIPVLIRVLAAFIPVLIGGLIFETLWLNPELEDKNTFDTGILDVAIVSISTAVYYWYLSTKIRAVSTKNASSIY